MRTFCLNGYTHPTCEKAHQVTTMLLIQIHDMRPDGGTLAVDLRHVLDALGEQVVRSSWLVAEAVYTRESIMVVGEEAADRLEHLSRSAQRIAGDVLQDLARRVTQVIWGEFQAFEGPAREPWLIVRAIDSTWYEVETDDQQVLKDVRRAFHDVREGDCRSILTFHNLP